MVVDWSPKLDFIILLRYFYIHDLDIISYLYQDGKNEEHLLRVVGCMVVGFNFLVMSVCSFKKILDCFFVDQISRITDLIKKYLNVANDKLWGCLKIIVTIHNYSTMIMFASNICFSINFSTNMVFL